MKALNHHSTANIFNWHTKVVDAKDDLLVQATLKLISNDVEKRYENYISNFSTDNLINISDSAFVRNHGELLSCYKSEGVNLKALKKTIRELQHTDLKGVCQYCGIGKPKTFDHFLPISDYPEFAVCAINLIPCCKDCNEKKKAYWKEDGDRGIINFYLDNFFAYQFLYAKVEFAFNVPRIVYHIENLNKTITDKYFSIVSKHFHRLELITAYNDESSNDLSELIRSFKIYTNNPSKAFF